MDYKNTLLMPKTDFDMRAKLNTKEIEIQKKWNEKKIYYKVLESNKKNKKFLLHDGPPYANGNLHVGHAVNKIIKDMIIRHNNNIGNYSPFICGWDTHGLPIENAVLKNKKYKNKKLSSSEIRELCKEYALNQVDNQIKQFSRMGLFTDYNIKYLTLEKEYEIEQLKLLTDMVEQNLIYRDIKPIYWSPSSRTALADAEIEYSNLESSSIYVDFSVVEGNEFIKKGLKIIIWTTTPWTIPSNQLLAINSNFKYVIFENNKNEYLIAENLLQSFINKMEWKNIKIIKKILGKKLIGISTKHPLYDRYSKVVEGHHVTDDSGTGIVHVAPGFGEDDYIIGKKHNINILIPIDDYGKFTKEVKDLDIEGMYYDNANKVIISKLKNNNKLLKLEFYNHQYPIDWRTKKPVIYRATEQWFVSIKKIRKNLIDEVEKVSWIPEWSKNNMKQMISKRDDWCISRQRSWGVPIIAFYDRDNKPQISTKIIKHVISLMEKDSHGTSIWFEKSADELLPKEYQNLGWIKENDIMDVWFDSGTSNLFIEKKFNFKIPVDIYFEGIDQFRGWFNSSLITSVIKRKKAPYKKIISHTFANDEKGHKMSKSLGNVVDPLKICDQYGADILRLWVASINYSGDIRIGNSIIKQISDAYRKIRNTARYLLGNLSDFNYEKNSTKNLTEVDTYMLLKTKEYKNKALKLLNEYNYNSYYSLTLNYIVNISSFYFDFIKDILYTYKQNSLRRRQIQTVLFNILETLLDTLKPVLVHTVEEIYSYVNITNKKDSVFLTKWKNINVKDDSNIIEKWDKVLIFRNDVNKAIEIARNNKIIKRSSEAIIEIKLKKNYQEIEKIKDLNQILIVNSFEKFNSFDKSDEYNSAFIKIKKKNGFKCERCWNIFNELENNEICRRCFENIN